MPLEVIQRLIGLLIGGFLPTDKQVNHILTPYMTYFYAHRLGSSIHDGVCRKKPIYNAQSRQSSLWAELPNPVYFGYGASGI